MLLITLEIEHEQRYYSETSALQNSASYPTNMARAPRIKLNGSTTAATAYAGSSYTVAVKVTATTSIVRRNASTAAEKFKVRRTESCRTEFVGKIWRNTS